MTDNKKNDTTKKNSTESEADMQRLNNEEKLAFEKIMGEIKDIDKGHAPRKNNADSQSSKKDENASASEPQSDELNDEQQAALDKIMAEINGGSTEDTAENAAETAEPQAKDDELDDEQQAALDKIMAEINGGSTEESPTSDVDASESEATKKASEQNNQTTAIRKKSLDDNLQDKDQGSEKVKLSLEEFDDELNNLLENSTLGKKEIVTNNTSFESAKEKKPNVSENTPENKAAQSKAPNHVDEERRDKKEFQSPSNSEPEEKQDYAILKEVSDSVPPKKDKQRSKKNRSKKSKTGIKAALYAVTTIMLISISAIAYWYFFGMKEKAVPTSLLPTEALTESIQPAQTAPEAALAVREQKSSASVSSLMPETAHSTTIQPEPSLDALITDIAATREHVLGKIEEIKELKTYYQNGVRKEYEKIKILAADSKVSSLKGALKHRQIELNLRAIKRRKVYMAKLDMPVKQLFSSSEQLLYLERKTRLLKVLSQGISTLPISEFKEEVSDIISNHLKNSNELTIDNIQIEPPSLESIWADFQDWTSKHSIKRLAAYSNQDKKINQEICNGNYDRKYLLTALTSESAQCLAKWTGKDLYLNGLKTLPPSVAKELSQWTGEWLSLNGLKELSPESAEYLSQWKGKRLSLNGLTRLSQKSTRHLSQWQGEQIEMIGLKSIGRWENYGTRLYLSESLRRKLQIQ